MTESTINFASLRKSGLDHIQNASGEIWTDYNLHDPGVTLLEQFCFALTEVVYRAEDLVEHYYGELDYKKAGLTEPTVAFSTRPVTLLDLEQSVSNASDNYERVLINPVDAENQGGLYDIFVVPLPGQDHDEQSNDKLRYIDSEQKKIKTEARAQFKKRRNLCEEARLIDIAEELSCKLTAEIEVYRKTSPALIAARIYDRCMRVMAGQFRTSDPHAIPQNKTDKFQSSSALPTPTYDDRILSDAKFFQKLSELEDVRNINSLSFSLPNAPDKDPYTEAKKSRKYLELPYPVRKNQLALKLTSQGMDLPFDVDEMNLELSQFSDQFHRKSIEPKKKKIKTRPLKAGKQKAAYTYTSMGELLPPAYATRSGGLPASAPEELQAHITQLKGLISLSDSLLINAHADISNLSGLFSNSKLPDQSYSTEALEFGSMEKKLSVDTAQSLDETLAIFDPKHDRKGRILDYLLGLHGEKFSQNTLPRYDYCHGKHSQQDAIIKNRSKLLKNVDRLNLNRSAGPNILKGEHGHNTGFGKKLEILLGFRKRHRRRLSQAFDRVGLGFGTSELVYDDLTDEIIPPDNPLDLFVPRLDNENIPKINPDRLIAKTTFLSECVLNKDILNRGVETDAYLLNETGNGDWQLLFDSGKPGAVFDCATFDEKSEAIERANQLRKFFVGLNVNSEGFYILEDILLKTPEQPFKPMTVHVFFSNWSARTGSGKVGIRPDDSASDAESGSREFQTLAEETVRIIRPAHIHTEIYWLDYHDMGWFEELYFDWHKTYREISGSCREADINKLAEISKKLRYFIDSQLQARPE